MRGVQSQGVAAVVKHFVGNEAETARTLLDSVIDERTLRELYLVPFEAAVREAGAHAIMTGYNRLNGEWCSESERLLAGILRGEWGFDGLVMTDWWAVGSTVDSLRAGLDLQMPGPSRYYGTPVAQAVRDGLVEESFLDAAVTHLLTTIERLEATPEIPRVTAAEGVLLAREAAAAGMVLLTNDGTLPLVSLDGTAPASWRSSDPTPTAPRSWAAAARPSAPQHRTTPLAALQERLPNTEIRYEPGCVIDRKTPALDASQLTTADGEPGLGLTFYAGTAFEGEPIGSGVCESSRLLYLGSPADGVPASGWSLRAQGYFVPALTGTYEITLNQVGKTRVLLDGIVVLDGTNAPVGGGEDFFGIAGPPITTTMGLTAGSASS